uniref:Uncharacterized protein n=1 Tax=Geospiza parvula TaxID=87175 RepID=A0A8U8BPG6_GEOPR
MGVLGALLGAVLVAVAVAEPAGSAAPHVVAEVLSCQADAPSLALSVTLDGRGLSWFHFPSSRWIPEAAELRAWPEGLETPAELLAETQLCREILGILGKQLAGLLPRARGTPVVSVFPARPPSPGGATTLVCLVENIFPPSLTVSWTVAGAGVARGVTLGPFVPNPDLTLGSRPFEFPSPPGPGTSSPAWSPRARTTPPPWWPTGWLRTRRWTSSWTRRWPEPRWPWGWSWGLGPLALPCLMGLA